MLAGESGTSRTGAKHYYYKCAGAKHEHSCKLKAIKKQQIERAAVIITVDKVLSNDETIERVADSIVKLQSKEDTTILALREQLKECEKGIENMLNAIQAGVLTPSTKERLDQLEARRSDLNISIMQAELTRPKYTKQQIVEWISQFKHGDPNDLNYQKQIIDIFLNSIYVYDDRYVFTYNFHGGTETIPREAVEEAFGSDLTHLAPPPPFWFPGRVFLCLPNRRLYSYRGILMKSERLVVGLRKVFAFLKLRVCEGSLCLPL